MNVSGRLSVANQFFPIFSRPSDNLFSGNVQEIIKQAGEYLRLKNLESPGREAVYLICELLQVDRIGLYAWYDRTLEQETLARYESWIQARAEGRPAAQIVGYRYFHNYKFKITPDVLIPRPETEELVETILTENPAPKSRVLDLCCGSGCIGITLLAERPDLRLDFSDLSPSALKVTGENIERIVPDLKDRIRVYQGDLFQAIPEKYRSHAPLYQAILSNPPYIFPDEYKELSPEVKDYEPALALVHQEPLELYRRIINEARVYLVPGGILCLELSPRLASGTLEIARKNYQEARILQDLSGKERFLFARL